MKHLGSNDPPDPETELVGHAGRAPTRMSCRVALYSPKVLAHAFKDPFSCSLPAMFMRDATSEPLNRHWPFRFRDAQYQPSQNGGVTGLKEPARLQSEPFPFKIHWARCSISPI